MSRLIDLYCPTCDYNLRGLPEDRCPECGTGFNRAELTRRAEGGPDGRLIVWNYILPLPFLFALSAWTSAIEDHVKLGLLILAGPAFVLLAPCVSFIVARKLERQRRPFRPNGRAKLFPRLHVFATTLGLSLFQYFMGMIGWMVFLAMKTSDP